MGRLGDKEDVIMGKNQDQQMKDPAKTSISGRLD